MELRFFEEAEQELEESRDWYRRHSLPAEAGFLREVDHAVEQITDAPHRWPMYLAGTRRYIFDVYPFSLIYFVENDVVHVVAVAHDKRKPGYWRKRLRR